MLTKVHVAILLGGDRERDEAQNSTRQHGRQKMKLCSLDGELSRRTFSYLSLYPERRAGFLSGPTPIKHLFYTLTNALYCRAAAAGNLYVYSLILLYFYNKARIN